MGCASAKIFLVVVKFFIFLFLEFVLVVVNLNDMPQSEKITKGAGMILTYVLLRVIEIRIIRSGGSPTSPSFPHFSLCDQNRALSHLLPGTLDPLRPNVSAFKFPAGHGVTGDARNFCGVSPAAWYLLSFQHR